MTTAKAGFTLLCCMAFAALRAQDNQPTVVNLDNELTFTVTGCTGDASAQRATVFFTITNPSKPDQRLTIGNPYTNKDMVALDSDSKAYACSRLILAGDAAEGNSFILKKIKRAAPRAFGQRQYYFCQRSTLGQSFCGGECV